MAASQGSIQQILSATRITTVHFAIRNASRKGYSMLIEEAPGMFLPRQQ